MYEPHCGTEGYIKFVMFLRDVRSLISYGREGSERAQIDFYTPIVTSREVYRLRLVTMIGRVTLGYFK